jgi:hypothetical protein
MKNKIFLVLAIVISFLVFFTCSEDSSTEPPNTIAGNFFPNANGNYYKYSVVRTDSAGSQTNGTRSSLFNGSTTLAGIQYQIQVDSVIFAGIPFTSASNSYFRKTDTGVFYFLDTTGLSAFIPDSLRQYIALDTELRALALPFSDGLIWTVFKMSFSFSVINVDIVNVTGYYEGKENITLNLTGGQQQFDAAKVRFKLTLKIPDPANPLSFEEQAFNAYAWLVSEIGIARWEGNGTLLNIFAGGGVDFDDTTTTTVHSLIEYDLN